MASVETVTPVVRVFQWNVLADSLATGDARGFPKVPTEALDTGSRRKMQLDVIGSSGADLVALQEVDAPDDFITFLKESGYETHYAARQDSPLGLLLAWKKDMFKMQRHMVSSYTECGQIAMFVRLKHIGPSAQDEGASFVFSTTHLKSTGTASDTKRYRDAKYTQMGQLSEFKHWAPRMGSENTVVCGDFNMSDPDLQGNAAYPNDTPTTFKARASGEKIDCEDHIATTYTIINRACLPDVPKAPFLPSLTYPSDHFSLCADFVLTNDRDE